MTNSIKQKLAIGLGILLIIVSCKKNTWEPAGQTLSDNENTPQNTSAKDIIDSRKTLFVIDKNYVDELNFDYSVWRITGLNSTPFKYKIFQTGNTVRVIDMCPGPGVNNLYIVCGSAGNNKDVGIWNVTMDAKKKIKIVNYNFSNTTDLDVDRINGKVYYTAGVSTIKRCNLDGSGTEQIIVGGNPIIKKIAVDGIGKRIFYTYKINGYAIIGCCNFNGQIIKPQVATYPNPNDGYDPIILDPKSQQIYTATDTHKSMIYTSMNGVNQNFKILCSLPFYNYGGWTYDFTGQHLYYTKWKLGPTGEIYLSDLQGKNEEIIVKGFANIGDAVAGLFTDQ